ncbi:MAG TPA: YtcA family lipoprotein [Candidatus Eisenbacteria bacterium]|nr:YtcA family lipoprotein [Candidatus Eisenbacteria bacterium]
MSFLRGSRSVKHRLLVLLIAPLLASCSRSPSIDILGSFFPAWLFCLALAIVLTAFVRLALQRLHMQIAFPILVYPSLAAFFTFALWLIFFY